MSTTVLIGGFWHESDTFNPMEAAPFSFDWVEGQDIFSWLSADGSQNELAGVVAELSQQGVVVEPTLAVSAPVAGPIPDEVFVRYLKSLSDPLRRLRRTKLDGVIFGLHGSTTVSGHPDAQLEVIQLLRTYLGNDIPIVVTFDLHASPSPELQKAVDGIVAYHTAPHRDMVSTGQRAARLFLRLASLPTKPTLISFNLPLLLPGEFGQTDKAPMRQIMAQVLRLSHLDDAVLEASLLQGYPWADNPHAMVNLIVVALGASSALIETLETIARSIFSVRQRMYHSVPVLSVAEAMDLVVHRDPRTLLYLCDSGDNPTAGALEDRVDLLAAAIHGQIRGFVFAPIVAPLTVALAKSHLGSTLSVSLGGQLADVGPRVDVDATVIGRFDNDELGGDTLILNIRGNLVVATTRRVPMHSPKWLADLGIDPKNPANVFVLKSGYLFPDYQDLLASVDPAISFLVATSGASSLDLNTFSYQRVPRPIYPLDDSGHWSLTLTITHGGHIEQMTPIVL